MADHKNHSMVVSNILLPAPLNHFCGGNGARFPKKKKKKPKMGTLNLYMMKPIN